MLRIDVPYIDQSKRYPTGCESVSTVMALQYAGVNISVDKFIDNYLYTTPATYTSTPNANILTQHSILPNSIFLFANV